MRSAEFFATHPVFTHTEFTSARQSNRPRSSRTADVLLARYVAAGRILPIRRGLYATVPPGMAPDSLEPDPFLVATKLAHDATVAYHAALQFRGKVYSLWHRYVVLTATNARPLLFRGNEFVAVHPPRAVRSLPDWGGGIVSEAHGGGTVRVTTLERAFVDVLNVPKLGGGWEEIWQSLESVEFFDLDAILAYVLALRSALTAARVGFFLEQHRAQLFVEDRYLDALRAHSPRQPRYLDSAREAGQLVKAWNLVVPERVLNRYWLETS